jgi:hypothetical protein
MEKRAKTGAWALNQDNVSEWSYMSTRGRSMKLGPIYISVFNQEFSYYEYYSFWLT